MRTVIATLMICVGMSAHAQQPETNRKALGELLGSYLAIKDALMADEGGKAAAAAAQLLIVLDKVTPSDLPASEAKVFSASYGKLKMNAEHIRENATKVDHQREHFDFLGEKILAVVKGIYFPHPPLFYFYSAQGNGGESAHWLSDRDELKSPYAGGKVRPSDKRVEEIAGE